MKITSLTIQAFRGFNKKQEFKLDNADIIVLYGPNGHGKSSIYDAIEWGLTGEINRFKIASPERKRTKFIRNLHADSADKSFVKLGIILSNSQRFFIERECTASMADRTDYGMHNLKLLNEDMKLYKQDAEAEEVLKSWLIQEEWLPKISSPITMLSLTHILSQEKISEFLKGMQERDRYDAISTIFGTDYFDKYREGFRTVRNTLNGELEKLKTQISLRNSDIVKLNQEAKELENKVKKNDDKNFNVELEHYIKMYPQNDIYKDDLEKLLNSIISNQADIVIENNTLKREYQLFKEIKEELPNMSYILKVHKGLIKANQLLQNFKNTSLTNMKIQELIETEKILYEDKESLKSLVKLQRNNQLNIDTLFDKKATLVKAIEVINLNLNTFSREKDIEFLTEIKSKILEEDYEYLNSLFMRMLNEYNFITEKSSISKGFITQISTLAESINQIRGTDDIYSDFLNSLNQYMYFISDEIKSCPACGTNDITKEDILKNVKNQQIIVNKNLPNLEKLKLEAELNLKRIEEEINSANNNIQEIKQKISELIIRLTSDLKTIEITISTEQQKQKTLQQKIDSLIIILNQFKKDCEVFGFRIEDNLKEQLEGKSEKLTEELNGINEMLSLESSVYLREELNIRKFNVSEIYEHEQILQDIINIQEIEINRVNRLAKLSQTISLDIKTDDIDKIGDNLVKEMNMINERLEKLSYIESLHINLQSMIEMNTERKTLIKIKKELKVMQNNIKELKVKEKDMENDSNYLLELMNKSNEAISKLNEKVFTNLKETIQTIFEQINSHPVFTKLELVMDKYRNNNCLTINVTKEGTSDISANAPYIFSSAQVNSIALTIFLAMSLKQKWSSLQLIGMDDPIQSMDEVNVISFIDLMRLFIDKHKKQIIISTHDQSFYKLILKKFRYYNLATIEYNSYGDKGPNINLSKESINSNQLELIYNQAKDELLQLDMI